MLHIRSIILAAWRSIVLICCMLVTGVQPYEDLYICSWQAPRAATIRGSLYISGGILLTTDQFSGGAWGTCGEGNGSLWQFDFSSNFTAGQQSLVSLLRPLNSSDKINFFPLEGSLLHNDAEFYGYGGMAFPKSRDTSSSLLHGTLYNTSLETAVVSLDYDYNIPDPPKLYNRFAGTSISVPSEDLAFYFGGLQSLDDQLAAYFSDDNSSWPKVSELLTANLSLSGLLTWQSTPLPDYVKTRTYSELVWVPVGKKGALLVIGGVVNPASLNFFALDSTEKARSQYVSPFFVAQLPIYDIAEAKWYTQNTTGTAPPQFAQACSTVAMSRDQSSINIYIYGGYDGTGEHPAYDDVWILSLPAFRWIRATIGNDTHGRFSHVCAQPYPNQMLVVGGVSQYAGLLESPTAMDVFDLNKLVWTQTYDPTVWSQYKVPNVVSAVIGGNKNGGASIKANWSDPGLEALFATPYKGTIKTWYPYKSHLPGPIRKALSSWAGAVLGTTLYLFIATVAIILLIITRRKVLLRSTGHDMTNLDLDSSPRLVKWMNIIPPRSRKNAQYVKPNQKLGEDEGQKPLALSFEDERPLTETVSRAISMQSEEYTDSLGFELNLLTSPRSIT